MKFTLFFIALGLLAVAPLRAQQTPARTGEQQAIRESLVQKIEQLKYEKMKTALGLDDDAAQKFFAIYKPAEKDIQSLVKERNDELKLLADATNTSSSDAALSAITEKIKSLNDRISKREQKLDADLTPVLTPAQRAKLLVFEHQFNERVRQQVAKHQVQRANAELRALRREMRAQRLKNKLLKKAQKTAAEHR